MKTAIPWFVAAVCAYGAVHPWSTAEPPAAQPSLLQVHDLLKTKKFVDLTHAFGPNSSTPPGESAFRGNCCPLPASRCIDRPRRVSPATAVNGSGLTTAPTWFQ